MSLFLSRQSCLGRRPLSAVLRSANLQAPTLLPSLPTRNKRVLVGPRKPAGRRTRRLHPGARIIERRPKSPSKRRKRAFMYRHAEQHRRQSLNHGRNQREVLRCTGRTSFAAGCGSTTGKNDCTSQSGTSASGIPGHVRELATLALGENEGSHIIISPVTANDVSRRARASMRNFHICTVSEKKG